MNMHSPIRKQLVLKVIDRPIRSDIEIRGAVQYIARLRDDHLGIPTVAVFDEVGTQIVFSDADKEAAKSDIRSYLDEEWATVAPISGHIDYNSEYYTAKRSGDSQHSHRKKYGPIVAYHFVVSIDGYQDAETHTKLQQAAKDFILNDMANEGWKLLQALHTDTDHPHVHFLLLATNSITNRKYRMNKAALYNLKTGMASTLSKNGIEVAVGRSRVSVVRLDSLIEDLATDFPEWTALYGVRAWKRLLDREKQSKTILSRFIPREKDVDTLEAIRMLEYLHPKKFTKQKAATLVARYPWLFNIEKPRLGEKSAYGLVSQAQLHRVSEETLTELASSVSQTSVIQKLKHLERKRFEAALKREKRSDQALSGPGRG